MGIFKSFFNKKADVVELVMTSDPAALKSLEKENWASLPNILIQMVEEMPSMNDPLLVNKRLEVCKKHYSLLQPLKPKILIQLAEALVHENELARSEAAYMLSRFALDEEPIPEKVVVNLDGLLAALASLKNQEQLYPVLRLIGMLGKKAEAAKPILLALRDSSKKDGNLRETVEKVLIQISLKESIEEETARLLAELISLGKKGLFLTSSDNSGSDFDEKNRNIRAREIGERLNAIGGFELMQKVAYQVRNVLPLEARSLEVAWGYIGKWLP